MQSYYLLSSLCLTFCAVTICEITTGLDCQAEKHVGETENSPSENSANDYYCPDGAPANYDGQSGRHHCCTMSLRQGKCPGKCRKLRSKRSMRGPPTKLRSFTDDEEEYYIEDGSEPEVPYEFYWPWEPPAEQVPDEPRTIEV